MSVAENPVSPEPRSAPARSRQETRRRLVEAATALFAREGLHGVTSARIAREAGVASGTFYLHFKDKGVLFREIVFAALDELRQRQERVSASLPGDSSEALRARIEELLAFAGENRDLLRIVFGRGGETAVGEEVIDFLVPGIERRLAARREAGLAPSDLNPAVAAQCVAGMTARVIAWWVEDPGRASAADVVETLLRMHPSRSADVSLT